MAHSRKQLILAVAAGLALADASVVTLALPRLLTQLHASVEGVAAVIGVYTVVLAVALLPAARLRERHGARPLGAGGLALFGAACVGCAAAGSLELLLAMRALQALGAAAALVAIFDLLEENSFVPVAGYPGPYHLDLGIEDNRLILDIRGTDDVSHERVALSLTPFRGIVKDYFLICESYYEAIRTAPPSRIQAIDMGRRGLHDEGSRTLQERLAGKLTFDLDTARRLFTLICALHWKG